MTFVVLPDGGQQPSTSGHQCQTGDSRMASAGTSSKPEMYSRGVQTGFSHPSGNTGDLQNLEICICGQAAEGNCFCESLGFLKDLEACKLVLQKGCGRSRVAILLSIHEEFCRSARGDPIINTRRRGSAYGDIRLRRPKAAPPPTLPRPRAQSMIVRNLRAASWNHDANVRRPQVSVKPKRSMDRASNERQKREEQSGLKAQSYHNESEVKQEQCLKKTGAKECAASKQECNLEKQDEGCLDQNSYVSKAWLLFHGCEKGKKNDWDTSLKNNELHKNEPERDVVEGGASCASVAKRIDRETCTPKDQSLVQKTDHLDSVNRITGLTVSSVMKSEYSGTSSLMARRKSGQSALSDVKSPSDSFGKLENESYVHPNLSAKYQDSGSSFCEHVVKNNIDVQIPHLCSEDESTCSASSRDAETRATRQKVTRQFECTNEVPPSDSTNCEDLHKNGKSEYREGCVEAARSIERMSCRDSGIGEDVSVSELKSSVGPCVIVEDQAEATVSPVEAESERCQSQDLLPLEFMPMTYDSVTDCISSASVPNNSQLPQCTVSEIPSGRSQMDSTLQVEDDSLLGACAILRKTEDVSSSVDSIVSLPDLDISVHAIDSILCGDQVEERNIYSGSERMNVKLRESTDETRKASCISSAVVMQNHVKSDHCLHLIGEESSENKTLRSMYLSGANIKLGVDHMFVSKLDIDLPSEQCGKKSEVNSDTVKEKICKKPETKLRSPKNLNPQKVGMLRYLICQSPLILYDANDSDFEDSDSDEDEDFCENNRNLSWMPLHILLKIFRVLDTFDLASLKCACSDFKWLIEYYDIRGVDSNWVEAKSYRNDPCMQCGKIRDPRGDVSLCRWHPKIYYSNGHIGRRYWTCCYQPDEDAPGCQVGLHNNNWTTSKVTMRSIPKPWRSNMWHLCSLKDVHLPDFP